MTLKRIFGIVLVLVGTAILIVGVVAFFVPDCELILRFAGNRF